MLELVPKEVSLGRWEPPPDGKMKMNVDGLFVAHAGEAGLGVVIN
jgi:hypothetical protein